MIPICRRSNFRLKVTAIFVSIVGFLFASVLQVWGQDAYENDNTPGTASVFVLGSQEYQNEAVQHHTFHSADDVDWVVFYALAGTGYAIRTFNIEYNVSAMKFADTTIELYDTDGISLIKSANYQGVPNHEDRLDWNCPASGIYYVKIKRTPGSFFTNEASYDLVLFATDFFYLPAYLQGSVKSAAGQPIGHARIKASGSTMTGSGLSAADGSFILSLAGGRFTVSISADGYQTVSRTIDVPGGSLHVTLSNTNIPPVAAADNFTATVGGSMTGNVLLNDTDADGDPLQAVLDNDVSHGSLSLNSNGTFTYRHNGDSSLIDSFTYHASDGKAASATVTVTINIQETITPLIMLLLH